MNKTGKKFIIIDAMSLAYKAYYAFINRPLQTSSGEPTSAVYGFINQLLKIIEDTKPDYIAVAFDSKEKTFRHERYEAYKSSRAKMPEDMIPQINRIKQVVEAFNIPIFILPGYEADDIVGTAVKKAAKLGMESYAITPDKDYIQIVNGHVKLIKPGRTGDELTTIDEEKVKQDYGFEPKQMIDYLALVGDSSDDIPGVAGIGPKTATPLIQQYGSIENIYKNLDSIEKKGLRKKLEEGKENAFLSKELATIMIDVPLEMDLEKTIFKKPDIKELNKIFTELEFRNLINRVNKIFGSNNDIITEAESLEDTTSIFDKKKVKYHLVKTKEGAENLAALLSKISEFVFDTETDSLNKMQANLAGVAFSLKPSEAYYVAINPLVNELSFLTVDLTDRLLIDDFINIFRPVFENKNIRKICQNGKYDIGVLKRYKIDVYNFYFDTMLASYVIDPDQKHGMDALSQKYLNYKPIPISSLIGDKKDASKIFQVNVDEISDYSCEDADITFRLYKILKDKLKNEKLEKIAYDIEFPLVPVLEDMERTGVKLDVEIMAELSKELEKLLNNYTRNIFALAGEEFNINSTKQLQYILFDKLKLKPVRKTKTGYSTDAKTLEAMRGEHDIIDEMLNYRTASKLKSTYTDALPKLIDPETKRIHTTFNQTIASTGRLSSIDPNLQNIPIRTEMGKEIRKAFVATNDEYLILSADYSQIELRIMAHLSDDEALKKAFQNGEDIHRSTAALVFMVKPEDVTPDMRRKAKEVNFGILYGIGPFGLKTRLGITQSHAKEIIDTYFSTFKNVKDFMDESVQKAKTNGYAETLLGRRRYLKNINSSNRVVRQFEERVAINMPIQGTAADMIKIAMINIFNELEKQKSKTKLVLQVHDELLFDIYKSELETFIPIIKEKMENALPLNVPILADIGTGKNWLDAH